MQTQKFIYFLLFNIFSLISLPAQNGKLFGVVTDGDTNEPLIAASVGVAASALGTNTDIDGLYELELAPGTYELEVSYTGYQTEKITALDIKSGDNIKMDFILKTGSTELTEVVIVGQAKKSGYVNLLLLQQKSVSMVTGISQEQIKLAPDRNTSDVLKRVSGASVQDNKYVVIRGLSDRYNAALINGLALPSTEPDKRAFSFDIFPSNLLDNLIIYKTATPDLPGEFAGGVIQLNTKEIPQDAFATLNLSTGWNSQSTFKSFNSYKGGKTDWLGYDDGTRALPDAIAKIAKDDFNTDQVSNALAFPNDWAVNEESSMRPSLGLQFSAGKSFGKVGVVGALTYSNNPRIVNGERGDFNVDKSQLYRYFDKISKQSVSLGGLFNLAWKPSPRTKVQLNNSYTVSADDQLFNRTGEDYEQTRFVQGYSHYYTSNKLFTTQLIGEHAISERQIKLNWAAGYNRITRDIPSYRRMLYTKSYDAPATDPYYAVVPYGNPSPNYAGNFYAEQAEDFYTGKVDLTLPYFIKEKKGSVKIGGLGEFKDREFDARLFGFIAGSFQTPQELFTQPIGQIFDPKNINNEGWKMKETTDRSDSYDAGSTLLAGYGMVEQALTNRLRFVGGARVESFNQTLNSFKILSSTEIKVDTTLVDVLPSAHFIYALSDSTNIRASIAKTVTRPNFRELAPFSFFDFFLFAGVNGNPALKRTQIWNADLRFETFRQGAQYFAFSLFYKHFENPIEQVFNNAQGAGTRNFQFQNVPSAVDYGAELETRIKLYRVAGFLRDFTLFGNVSYVFSDVDISGIPGAIERPLYGQSPYLINGGLTYSNPDVGFSSTLLLNRIGRRVWVVGQDQYLHTWEGPRSVLDFQVTKKISRVGELKLTIGDLLNQEAVFYQDQDDNGKFNGDQDTKIVGQKFGTNVSLSFNYSFGRS